MRLLLTLSSFFIMLLSQGQNKQLLYNVSDLPQTLMSNPGAIVNFDGHFGIPLFSHISLSAGSSGVNLFDIFDDSNPNVNQRVTSTINRLTSKDYFTAQEQLEILSMGWRLNKDDYFSAGIYQEMDLFAYFPKDPAILVSQGNANYINVPFDFSHVSFTGEVLTVYHLGLNRKIDNQLTVGARVKMYSGIFNVQSVNNTGIFLTRNTPEGPNYYRHFAEDIDVRVNTSGFTTLRDENQTVQEASKDLLSKSFFGGNIGVGIDLGATYKIQNNLIVTGSIQDLGLMFQRDDVENYTYKGTYQTDGIEPLFPGIGPSGAAFPYWDEFEDEVDRNLVDETLNESYVTWRPFKLNASLQFRFGEDCPPCDYRIQTKKIYQNKVGIHLFGIKRPGSLKYALSTYYDTKVIPNLRIKVAYTLDDFSYTNVGLLLSTQLKKFNFYLAADNLFGYLNLAKSRYQSVQLGFQFILNK
ncbi:DUF5723 family protein [Gillisia limnaea]|nr:DUF5723 family protein [Gillisia limnaea]